MTTKNDNSVSCRQEPNTSTLNEIREQIKQAQDNYEQSFLEIGRALLEAKQLFSKHGEWLTWLDKNVDLSPRKAQRLMRIAQFFSNTPLASHLNVSQAYILTALPQNEIGNFLANPHFVSQKGEYMRIEMMSRRDLENVVRDYLRNRNPKSDLGQTSKKPKPPTIPKNDFIAQYKMIRNSVNNLAKLIEKNPNHSNSRDLMIKDICDLCTDILQKFSGEGLEDL